MTLRGDSSSEAWARYAGKWLCREIGRAIAYESGEVKRTVEAAPFMGVKGVGASPHALLWVLIREL